MDKIMSWVGLIGWFLFSLGLGIDAIKKEKLLNRVGGMLSLVGSACFLAVIIGKLVGKF